MLSYGFLGLLFLPLVACNILAIANDNNTTDVGDLDGVIEFELVFPRNETYAPAQYFPLVLRVRNSTAAWRSGMIISMTIWPDSKDTTPPWNSRFNFPKTGHTSGEPPSEPYYFAIAGSSLTNSTEGGFTVIWSVVLQETCTEDGPYTESFSSAEYNVRFSTAFGAQAPDVEAAMSACSEPVLVLTPSAWLDEGACPVLDANSTTLAAAESCAFQSVGPELAANVSTAMLELMGCTEGNWQMIQQPCIPPEEDTEENIGRALQWGLGSKLAWTVALLVYIRVLL